MNLGSLGFEGGGSACPVPPDGHLRQATSTAVNEERTRPQTAWSGGRPGCRPGLRQPGRSSL